MKSRRQDAILRILSEKHIYTQEELTAELAAAGISATQATISRDIREMGLVKEGTPRGMRYAAPADVTKNPFERVFREGLVSAESAGNMLVLKTLSGMAMAVAAALDEMGFSEILGSVAGDDTIICVVKTKAAAVALAKKL